MFVRGSLNLALSGRPKAEALRALAGRIADAGIGGINDRYRGRHTEDGATAHTHGALPQQQEGARGKAQAARRRQAALAQWMSRGAGAGIGMYAPRMD